METESLKFLVRNEIGDADVQRIERAMKKVDADASVSVDVASRTVAIESWLMPEEFIVAFTDENLDAKIV